MKSIEASIIGQNFDSLDIPKNFYEQEHREWLADEGLDPDWTITFLDESLEFILNQARQIITVFAKSQKNIEDLATCKVSSTKEFVLNALGTPSKQGNEFNDPILGYQGSWVRYDFHSHSLHIQFKSDDKGIEVVTLMSPSSVP